MQNPLSHVDAEGRPRMVDVAHKPVSARIAEAEALVWFPADVAETLRAEHLRTAKGSVLDVAVVAGTMAAKRTADLIPFCHPLALERIDFVHDWASAQELRLRCSVALHGRTGVEMEALVGVQIAAATVYDMCKALSHAIEIRHVRLLAKRGGKNDHGAPP